MKKYSVLLILIFYLLPCYAEMDWENMTIRESSTDQMLAAELLRKELYNLQYDEAKTVGDFLRMNFDRENRLSSLLSEYRVNQHYLTDGSIEYVYELSMRSRILALMLPETKAPRLVVPMLCPSCGQEWPKGRPVPGDLQLIPKEIEPTKYTGIVIDCRGFEINPCIFPKIVNEMSEEIYSINFAEATYFVERGLVLYTRSDLYNNPRIGFNPLRFRAIGVSGDKKTNIKISSFDARRIHGSQHNLNLLKECRVAIIFGQ